MKRIIVSIMKLSQLKYSVQNHIPSDHGIFGLKASEEQLE